MAYTTAWTGPSIGISNLYLVVARKPVEEALEALESGGGEGGQGPDSWELVDMREYSLTGRVLKRLSRLDLRLTVHSPYYDIDIASLDREKRRLSILRLRQSIEATASLEGEGWVLHPGMMPKHDSDLRAGRIANEESIALLYDYAMGHGVACLLENMIPGKKFYMTAPEEFEEFSESTGIRVEMVFDPGHANLSGLIEPFLRLSSKFGMVHVHDNDGSDDSHRPLGTGSIPWERIVSHLSRQGYTGKYVVEDIEEPHQTMARIRKMVKASTPHGVPRSPQSPGD